MERDLRFGTDRSPKKSHKQGLTQRKVSGHQFTTRLARPIFVSMPQVPDKRPGIERMVKARVDLTITLSKNSMLTWIYVRAQCNHMMLHVFIDRREHDSLYMVMSSMSNFFKFYLFNFVQHAYIYIYIYIYIYKSINRKSRCKHAGTGLRKRLS